MIKITIHIKRLCKVDIGVNKKQVIQDVFTILYDNNVCEIPDITYVKVCRLNRLISILSTYEQAGIIEGDILVIET